MIYNPKIAVLNNSYEGVDIIGTERQRVQINKDYEVSIIRGYGTHSNHDTVEIAIIYNGNMCDMSMLEGIIDKYLGDTVLDYVTFEELDVIFDFLETKED